MKKKIISLVLFVILIISAFTLAACGDAKNDGLFGDYVRKPETPPADRNANVDADDGVVFDGKFDEDIWQNLKWVDMVSTRSQRDDRYTMVDLDDCTIKATGTMTEKGMYYAMITDDPINWNGNNTNDKRDPFQKTGMSVYIADCSYRSINDGAFEFGFATDGTYQLRKRMLGEYMLYPVLGIGTGVNVKGEMNTANTQGYGIEVFIPWKSLGYDSKPDAIMSMFTIERNQFARNNSPFAWELIGAPYGVEFGAPGTWFKFDEGGRVIGEEGENFGHRDDKNAYSEGFDLSHDKGENPYVDSTAGPDAKLYIKNFKETKFYVETTIKVNEIYNGDQFPKVGWMFTGEPTTQNGESHFRSVMAMYDVTADASAIKNFIATETNIDTVSGWAWSSPKILNANNDIGITADNAKIAVYRNGSKFYYFMNDVFVGERTYDYIGDNTKTHGAILSFNVGAKYYDYTILRGEEAAVKGDAMVASSTPKRYTIDGDESDWTEYSGRVLGSYAYDGSGKEFTVKAILKDDGLYFLTKAKHAVYLRGNGEWSHNTSLEIGLTTNGGADSVTLHVTPDGKYLCNAVMKTADSGVTGSNTRYTTVTEGYVSENLLEKLGAITDGKVRVAFSWRTGTGKKLADGTWDPAENDVINSLGRLDSQPYIWYQVDTPAWEKDHRSYVGADGITLSGKATERTIDGDDADWADWSGRESVATGTTDATKGFRARYYKGSDGLYFFVRVTHNKYSTNDSDCGMLSNFVIETATSTSSNTDRSGTRQFFFTPIGCVRQGDAVDYVMKTTGTEGNYVTIVEGFIPNNMICNPDSGRFDPTTGLGKNGYYVRIGGAWRTRGDKIAIKGGEYDYWEPTDASGWNVEDMYYLTENGISKW